MSALVSLAVAGTVLADLSVRVDEATRKYTVMDGDRPVLTYNFGTVPVPAGVGGKYAVARSNYVHPLYGPNGAVLTRDYSPDHPHHRGIYWAWPEVTYKGQKRDLHALQGVFARPVKMHTSGSALELEVNKDGEFKPGKLPALTSNSRADPKAEIVAENVWKWGDAEPIVKETATIRVGACEGGVRPIDFLFRFEALADGITIARRGQSNYGGFNVRLSARENMKIVKHAAAAGLPHRAAWGELVGVPPDGKGPVGVFLLQSPLNPEYPGDWVDYPKLAWLQPTFPSKGTAYALDPKTPLELAFRVIVRSGEGLAVPPEKLFADYVSGLPDPLSKMIGWQPGQSRLALTAIEEGLREASAGERREFESHLLKLIADTSASGHFKAWACKQLVVAGSDACVPVVAPILNDDVAWMQAADALLSRPGDTGLAAMREALRSLNAVRRSSLCHLLGVRRDARAVALLASQAKDAESAIEALGRVGTPEAVSALESMSGDAVNDALLQAAERLARSGKGDLAAGVYDRLLGNTAAKSWHRAGALCGLAELVPGKCVTRIAQTLSSEDRHMRNGAAAALRVLDAAALVQFRSVYADAPTGVRLALLDAWAAKGVTAAGPEALSALGSDDEAVRLAGVRALGTIGGAGAVASLLDLASKGGAPGKEAETALGRMEGEGVDAELNKAFSHENEALAAVAVACAGARKAPGYLDAMLGVLKQKRKSTVRAALTALRNDGGAAQLGALAAALGVADTLDREGVARAIVAICAREPDPERALARALGVDMTVEARAAMLSALPAMGGKTALAFVSRTSDEAAVRALLKWPDGDGVAPLLLIARDEKAAAPLRGLAAAGLVQLAKRVLPSGDKRRVLKDVLPLLPDDKARAGLRVYIAELSMRNLALNAAATSSRPSERGHPPAHAVDGKKTTASYWGCTPPPCTLTLDLGKLERVGRTRVTPYWDGRRFYRYRVETSVDAQKWDLAVDAGRNSKPSTPEGVMHDFKARDARYVRVVMLHNSANPGLHIVELEVYAPIVEEDTP